MTKFVPAIIAAAAMSTLAGCVAESGDVAGEESLDQTTQAACENREGTNAMLVKIGKSMATELGRLEVLTDFEQFRGSYNQMMLRLKAGGGSGSTAYGAKRCPGGTAAGCSTTVDFLAWAQDVTKSGNARFQLNDGTYVDPWTLASRLATGYDNMKTYKQNGQFKYDPHQLTFVSDVVGGCDTLSTFNVTKPDGTAMTATQSASVRNALRFMEGNGPNPWIQFSSTATTATFDPGGNGEGTGTTNDAGTVCQVSNNLNAPPVAPDANGVCPVDRVLDTTLAAPNQCKIIDKANWNCACATEAPPSKLVRKAAPLANQLKCTHY